MERAARLKEIAPTKVDEAALEYEWRFWARQNQLPPAGAWLVWLVLAGRGFGKTRTGAEWVRERAAIPRERIALVGPTASDVRDVMIEGESGILSISPPWDRPSYEPSKRRLTWANGATAMAFSGEEPDRLRGPQHGSAWCFIAGTMVETRIGPLPIETIRVGTLLLTRMGMRRVIGIARRKCEVGTVRFSNGAVLTGTAQHPVLDAQWWSWTCLSRLTTEDKVFAGRPRRTATSPATSAGARSTSTDGSGSKRTAPSLTASSFITRTETASTTRSPISNCSTTQRTLSGTWTSGPSRRHPAPGAGPMSRGSGTSTRLSAALASIEALTAPDAPSEHAGIADAPFCPGAELSVVSVASTWQPEGEAFVYCLKVEGEPEYFANGILVHNCDELAAWKYPDTWDQLMFGLRLGQDPRVLVTTTPRPIPLVKALLKDPTTRVTRGSTFDNAANLADTFLTKIREKYEGSRLGRQELFAEVLDDNPGALWSYGQIDQLRVHRIPAMRRIVVAIDPAVTATKESDETGIVVVGLGEDGHGYVLEDVSGRFTPDGWARLAVARYVDWRADRIVAEVNNGGDMVETIVRTVDRNVSYTAVHATRGKRTRAEPIAALYEQGRVHHVGSLPKLEDQQVQWDATTGEKSPDRVDALVWGLTELMLGGEAAEYDQSLYTNLPKRRI